MRPALSVLLLIVTSQLLSAGHWEVTLTSGEKFPRVNGLRLDQTILYLVPENPAPDDLPIPVYLGDLKTVRRVRDNRCLTLVACGCFGRLLGQFVVPEFIDLNETGRFGIREMGWAGSIAGSLLALAVSGRRVDLSRCALDERKIIIDKFILRERFR
ncbi:MAG: hypothetical protein ABIA75_10490 [Candidatus Neomarinimicrobiota bacterium]